MTLRTLTRRSLRFHARSHLGVLLGAIIGSAALIGALVVGDSVRASLRERALSRLGWVNIAMASGDHFFSKRLIQELVSYRLRALMPSNSAVALQLPASARTPDGTSRANQVNLFGVYGGFGEDDSMLSHISSNGLILNEALAAQLRAKIGDEILLRIQKSSGPSREVAVGPRNNASVSFRLNVQGIASANEMGDFSLRASQLPPLNAFMRIDELGEQANLVDKANLLLLGPMNEGRISELGKALMESRGLKRDLLLKWLTLKSKLGLRINFGATAPMATTKQLDFANSVLKREPSLSLFGFNLRASERLAELSFDRNESSSNPRLLQWPTRSIR